MITYSSSEPGILRVDAAQTDSVLAALAKGEAFEGSGQLPQELTERLTSILSAPRGEMSLEISGADLHLTHALLLAQAGVLRRTRLSGKTDEIALSPTAVLPGVLLRLAGIAPVEPLAAEIRPAVRGELLDGLFDADPQARREAWAGLQELSRNLPAPLDPELDSAPPRALRATRRTPSGDRTAQLLMLRGRYLLVAPSGLGTSLVGTDPTTASRAISSLLNPAR